MTVPFPGARYSLEVHMLHSSFAFTWFILLGMIVLTEVQVQNPYSNPFPLLSSKLVVLLAAIRYLNYNLEPVLQFLPVLGRIHLYPNILFFVRLRKKFVALVNSVFLPLDHSVCDCSFANTHSSCHVFSSSAFYCMRALPERSESNFSC